MAKQVVNMTKKEGLELLKKIKDHSEKKGYPGAVTKTKKKRA
ncbi:hypothetical protein ACDZ29_12170 [Peribacillus sp. RS7]|uniref:Uncharacterized protein n=1 Tax=Peribacillus simplex TaxID=1478 RepID=A0AAN2PAZ1_9BACI|nr:hypothetical protein [Peribacillus simplex]WVN12820.1 hypothetical protein V2I71_09630 [Peribacillus frigoritolerans]CEG24560.1 hypothetical protein BN1180_05375 [Peribacillus simplex]